MKKITTPLLFVISVMFPTAYLYSQDNHKLINDYIIKNQLKDYKKSDLTNFVIDNVDPSSSLKSDVVKIQQTYQGLPIYNSAGTALVKNKHIIYYSDNFVKDYNSISSSNASITKEKALKNIAEDLGNLEISTLVVANLFEKSPNDSQSAKQRLVYAVDDLGSLRLSYEYLFSEPKSSNYWNILVDATTGKILEKHNLTNSCNFKSDAYSSDHSHINLTNDATFPVNIENKPTNSFNLLLVDNASYNVFALPLEAPTFGSRSLINNPWLLSSSPQGWHSDGVNHYTTTRGNNVYAYEDTAGSNLVGFSPDGGTNRNFNFPYSTNGNPAANQSSSITNLFYLNNKIHDVFYKFGFTESARNFQHNNFGNGGLDDDSVFAEAQDGGGINNANFSSPPDNYNPKMQMYLWSATNQQFFYNAPTSAVSRSPAVGVAQFGPALSALGTTGDVLLSSVLDGCTALPAGALAGKIALVERGTCSFTIKVKNVQDAGATAAIIYNNIAGAVGGMSGTDATITIPSVLITNTEGIYIKNLLTSNTIVNITLKNDPATAITPDGSFDNGIVTHEYGHGISNRLTGSGYGCLSTTSDKEQMGEGWSDFFALMLTNKPGDNASVARGIGTYASNQVITDGGIRPAKYSPFFNVNNFTYGRTNGMEYTNASGVLTTDVHSVGFVWATMLWDLHWKYVEKYGYASDVTSNTTNGSSRVLQLVTDALKLQVCNPTFIDGRNAILAADLVTTGGADKCMIWRTFAQRGLGVTASAGSKTNINDQVEDFTVPADCVLATNEVKSVKDNISIYPNPAKNEFYINFPANTLGKVNVEIYDMSGKLVSSENKITPNSKKSIATVNLVNGVYIVKVKGLGIDLSSKLMIKK